MIGDVLMNTKVYVVYSADYTPDGDYEILGVFSSEELAKNRLEKAVEADDNDFTKRNDSFYSTENYQIQFCYAEFDLIDTRS
jgi:hypothetical protein